MIEIKSGNFGAWIASLLMVGMLSGCTHVNPATGQSEIDYGATAGVAGAALGAAALGVALSNNDDDRYYGGPGYYGGGGYYGGSRGHNTYNKTNNVYVNNNKELNNRRAVNRTAGTNRNRTQVKKGGMNRSAANVNRAARPAKGQRARHR